MKRIARIFPDRTSATPDDPLAFVDCEPGLSVRHWVCGCGARHDRDINAAINTLIAAVGSTVESEVHHAA